MTTKAIQFIALLVVIFLINAFAGKHLPSAEFAAKKTIDQKVDSVLALMTLEEKIGQLTLFTSDWESTGPTLRPGYQADIRAGRVGAIFNAHTAAFTRELQRLALEETRLGIPLLFGYDVVHGYKTIFPIPLGEAASWDLASIERAARVAAVEASAAGLHWTFAPMVDIARDPRWGRVAEGAGECPFLGSRVAEARTRGYQGDRLDADNTVAACVKHFAAYGAAQAGRDYHSVDISEQTLRDVYLPPFRAAIDAGARSVMSAFNEIFGEPATGSAFLLRDILREEWGFAGFTVSDYTSINEMVPHGFAKDEREAGRLALQAGLDMDMQGAVYHEHLVGLVGDGKINEELIDESVRRILRVKFELGLFDDPYRYSDPDRERRLMMAAPHREAAKDMARRSMVLLKNDRQTLPFRDDIRSLAVIGPLADDPAQMLGSWSAAGEAKDCVSPLAGIRARLGDKVRVTHAKGCAIEGELAGGFAEALRVARSADAIVLALGEAGLMSGEAASRAQLGLPGVQEALAEQILQLGKPTALALFNGRPLCIPDLRAPAILVAWFPGTEGGHALADVLFGDYNPSGKLPVTFPRLVGQIPIHHDMKNTGRPFDAHNKYTSKYLDVENSPQWPFGWGLSYTTFEYGAPTIDRPRFRLGDTLVIRTTLRNAGQVAGEETAQLYVRDMVGSLTRPVRELKGFQKIWLAPGESREINFSVAAADLGFHNRQCRWVVEPGEFTFFVGGNSVDTQAVKAELLSE